MFTTIKKLLCKFTYAEKDERAQLLVSLLVEQDEVEEKRRDRNKRWRDELKTLRGKIRAATYDVRTGGEERDVECRVFFNQPVAGTKQIMRGDTGEVVSEVVMTEAELQDNLFKPGELETMFGAGPAPDAAAEQTKDALFDDAVSVVVEFGKANEKMLQKHLNVGFPRAAALLAAMERAGIVGPANGKSREVLKRPEGLDVDPKQDGEQPEASA